MIPGSLSQIERGLRQAVERHQHAEAARLTRAFCQAAARHLEGLAGGDPEIAAIANRVFETLTWAKVMTLAARDSQAAELRRLNTLSRYFQEIRTSIS